MHEERMDPMSKQRVNPQAKKIHSLGASKAETKCTVASVRAILGGKSVRLSFKQGGRQALR